MIIDWLCTVLSLMEKMRHNKIIGRRETEKVLPKSEKLIGFKRYLS